MSRAKRKDKVEQGAAIASPCPYCSDPDFLDKVLTPTPGDRLVNPEPVMRRFGSHWPKVRRPRQFKAPKPPPGVRNFQSGGDEIDPRKVVTLKTPEIKRGRHHNEFRRSKLRCIRRG